MPRIPRAAGHIGKGEIVVVEGGVDAALLSRKRRPAAENLLAVSRSRRRSVTAVVGDRRLTDPDEQSDAKVAVETRGDRGAQPPGAAWVGSGAVSESEPGRIYRIATERA
jgi:hypothetical protein